MTNNKIMKILFLSSTFLSFFTNNAFAEATFGGDVGYGVLKVLKLAKIAGIGLSLLVLSILLIIYFGKSEDEKKKFFKNTCVPIGIILIIIVITLFIVEVLFKSGEL